MKKTALFFLFFLPAIFLVGICIWWRGALSPVAQTSSLVDVIIPRGMSASQIGNKLEKVGIIKSPLAFKVYVMVTGKAARIQAGQYRLSPNKSLAGIITELVKGPIGVWITIPEGLRREEIVDKLLIGLDLKDEAAITFKNDFLGLTSNKEGYLFPDTYLFPREIKASTVVSKMTETFNKRVDFTAADMGKTVLLASLVERETKGSEEKPIVAGILLKRLSAGWPLQVDATLQYAVATVKCRASSGCRYWEPLTKEDMDINSLYNSYTHQGLPPSPICNPGLVSLKAAASPQESSYWFYLHDTKGQIHYAVTTEDHAENIKKYL